VEMEPAIRKAAFPSFCTGGVEGGDHGGADADGAGFEGRLRFRFGFGLNLDSDPE
jgi:hypothetical protein